MPVEWNQHRFSGGALALDTTNTMVLRGDPQHAFDRFDDPDEIARFAAAATIFRAEELGNRPVVGHGSRRDAVVHIREATDSLFRACAAEGALNTALLQDFLKACAAGLAGHAEHIGSPGKPFGDPATPMALEAALAVSALSLLAPDRYRNIKICRNCRWLFLDRSRNSSRVWCDMTVCGNRRKAQRHYRRKRAAREEGHA